MKGALYTEEGVRGEVNPSTSKLVLDPTPCLSLTDCPKPREQGNEQYSRLVTPSPHSPI